MIYDYSFQGRYGKAPIAISTSKNASRTEPHIHNEIEILYIENGCSEIKINTDIYQATAGDLYFVNPLEVHSITSYGTDYYCHQCICFDLSLIADKKLSDELQKGYATIPHRFEVAEQQTADLIPLFKNMFAAVEKNSEALLFEVNAIVSMMFSHFIQHHLIHRSPIGNKQRDFCAHVVNFISLHYSEELTSKEVARFLFYTQSHFCRQFKSAFGVTFSEYLVMYRLLISKEKLLTESKSINMIATECGFCSTSYFTSCFKKTFKNTPLKYRKENTKLNKASPQLYSNKNKKKIIITNKAPVFKKNKQYPKWTAPICADSTKKPLW